MKLSWTAWAYRNILMSVWFTCTCVYTDTQDIDSENDYTTKNDLHLFIIHQI